MMLVETVSDSVALAEGILDATKVVRCSIENGSSVAGALLTVEGLVIDDIEENLKLMQMARQTPQMVM